MNIRHMHISIYFGSVSITEDCIIVNIYVIYTIPTSAIMHTSKQLHVCRQTHKLFAKNEKAS